MRTRRVELGQILQDTEGFYKIVGFGDGAFCTVKVGEFDRNDCFRLTGEELYLSEEEVKRCLKYETGLNIDKIEIPDEREVFAASGEKK